MSPWATAPPGVVWRAAALAAAATALTTVMAWRLGTAWSLTAAYPTRVGFICAGVLLAAVAGVRGRHPFARLGSANLVTGLRASLVAVLAAVVFEPGVAASAWWLVGMATATALADLADGVLARRSGLMSAFGARFDMEVDALLIFVLSALVWRAGKAGPWVLAAGLLRYLFVAAALVVPWLRRPLPPSRRRQAVCVAQITTLIVALGPVVPPALSAAAAAASVALLVWSFAVDVAWLDAARGNAAPSPAPGGG